jgi:hypothetical protein
MKVSDEPDPSASGDHGSVRGHAEQTRKRPTSGMKRIGIGQGVVRPLILGMLLGGLGATWLSIDVDPWSVNQHTWPPGEINSACNWQYLKVDEDGWSTHSIDSYQDLDTILGRPAPSGKSVAIPIFPSVYHPLLDDKLYYDAILESDIEPGDKVLVIGTGSGADSWAASLKSQSLVYVVEINPLAVANARATARIAGFEIKPIVGDIRQVELPDDFSEFDFVLWNMPYLWDNYNIESMAFHDGDDGSILKGFLKRLPSLVKKGGTTIVLNTAAAGKYIHAPGVTTKEGRGCMLFVIPNP